jgi:GntR family transcriptional regulator
MVFLQVQPDDGLAIYDQIVRQVKFAIADEVVSVGELVPSVRELARQLTINPNTVARAYRQLQDEGILEAVRGLGLRVTTGAARRCRTDRVDLIRARLKHVLAEAVKSGLTSEEVLSLVQKELARTS